MHNLKLWTASNKYNNLSRFISTLKNIKINSYFDLHKWSIEYKNDFWKEIWKFTKIIGELKGKVYLHNKEFIKCKFFEDSKINYTENCLSKNNETDACLKSSPERLARAK